MIHIIKFKHSFKIVTILIMLFLLSCSEEQRQKNTEEKARKKFEISVIRVDFKFTTCSDYSCDGRYKKKAGNRKTVPAKGGKAKRPISKRNNIIPRILTSYLSVSKTAMGVIAEYTSIHGDSDIEYFPNNAVTAKLNVKQWQDFIEILYQCCVSEWERTYGDSIYGINNSWKLKVYYSDKLEPDIFEGYEIYPPNWWMFREMTNNLETKIRTNTDTK